MTQVAKSGRSRQSDCFAYEPTPTIYTREAKKAIDRSRFEPASVNHKKVEVSFLFRVSFSWDGDICNFAAVPNWGFDDAAMSLEHVAPQEILSRGRGWIDDLQFVAQKRGPITSFDRVASQSGSISFGGAPGRPVFISVLVSDEGFPTEPRLERNFSATDWEIQVPSTAAEQPRFIPGFYQQKPVAMRYFTVLYAYDY